MNINKKLMESKNKDNMKYFKETLISFFKQKLKSNKIIELENNFSKFYPKEKNKIFDKKFGNQLLIKCKLLSNKKINLNFKETTKQKANILKYNSSFDYLKYQNTTKNYLTTKKLNQIYENNYKKTYNSKNLIINKTDTKICMKLKSFDKYTNKNKKIKRLNWNIVPKYLYNFKYFKFLYKNEKNLDKIDSLFKLKKSIVNTNKIINKSNISINIDNISNSVSKIKKKCKFNNTIKKNKSVFQCKNNIVNLLKITNKKPKQIKMNQTFNFKIKNIDKKNKSTWFKRSIFKIKKKSDLIKKKNLLLKKKKLNIIVKKRIKK